MGGLSVIESTISTSGSLLGVAEGLEVRARAETSGEVVRLRIRLKERDVRGAKWLSAIDAGVDGTRVPLSGRALWVGSPSPASGASMTGSDEFRECVPTDVEEVVRLCVSDGMHDA